MEKGKTHFARGILFSLSLGVSAVLGVEAYVSHNHAQTFQDQIEHIENQNTSSQRSEMLNAKKTAAEQRRNIGIGGSVVNLLIALGTLQSEVKLLREEREDEFLPTIDVSEEEQ